MAKNFVVLLNVNPTASWRDVAWFESQKGVAEAEITSRR